MRSALLSVEAGLMCAETCGGVPRLSEINGHVEILLENGKMVFSVGGGVPVLSTEIPRNFCVSFVSSE